MPFAWYSHGLLPVVARRLTTLEAFAALDPRSLTHLSLRHVPFTDALAAAVLAAAPNLASLDIADVFSVQQPLVRETPGICRLITSCSQHLTSLTLGGMCAFIPPLAAAICACPKLRHLSISIDGDVEGEVAGSSLLRLAATVRALSELRSLDLGCNVDSWRAAHAVNCMTQLASLTQYCFDIPEDNLDASQLFAEYLKPFRSLACLTIRMPFFVEELKHLAAAVPQLTYLCATTQRDLPALDNPAGSIPLPAALRELQLESDRDSYHPGGVHPRELLALQLPTGLTRLSVRNLWCSYSTHVYDYHADIVEALQDASAAGGSGGALAGNGGGGGGGDGGGSGGGSDGSGGGGAAQAPLPPCPGFQELLDAVRRMYGRYDSSMPLTLVHAQEPHPLTWPAAGDGHARLFAALRPLRLKQLEVCNRVLGFSDAVALAEHLIELEVRRRGTAHGADLRLLSKQQSWWPPFRCPDRAGSKGLRATTTC